MNSTRCFRRAFFALVPVAAMALSLISLGPGPALAQSPPAASPTPAPAASTPPVPAAATPVTPTRRKQVAGRQPRGPRPAPAPPAPVQTADPFGEQIALEPKRS